MATLNAFFQFDINLLNLNWYVANFESHYLAEDVNDPWQDRYTVFTPNEALVLEGNGFGYSGAAEMISGTVEALSEWFYDTRLLDYFQTYSLSGLNLTAQEIHDAMQTAAANDDFALLQGLLSGADLFVLSAFDDRARGHDGADVMYGLAGADILRGDDGRDKLFGGNGKDKLFGGDGNDLLEGGWGSDYLKGGNGNDILHGGAGRDRLEGGHGEDVFMFATGDGKDVVRDFQASLFMHDRIDVSGLTSVKGWADLKSNHMAQDGNNVVIDGGDGDVLVLRNTDIDSLLRSHFDF